METSLRDRSTTSFGHRSSLTLLPRATKPGLDPQAEAVRLCEVGKILLDAGRYQEALDQFEQALAVQPHDVESWYNRADALAALDRHEAALHSLEQAQALADVEEPRFWVQKAVILLMLNSPKTALTHCNYALWLEPDHAQAWLFRGVALQRLGRYREAYRSYQRVSQGDRPTLRDRMQKLCHDITQQPQAS